MNRRFTSHISEAYGQHSEKYSSILEPMLKPMADEIIALGRVKPGETVLDLATGSGHIARAASQSTSAVVGVDLSAGFLAIARQLSAGKIPLVAGDAHWLPFKDRSFGLVTCGISLSHFPDVSSALREILRVLRPEGRFITSAWGNASESPARDAAFEVRKHYLEDQDVTFEGSFSEDLWADVNRGCTTLEEDGFVDVQVTTLPLAGEYRDASEALEAAFAWPVFRYRIAKLNFADQEQLWRESQAAILKVNDLHWRDELHYYQATRPGD